MGQDKKPLTLGDVLVIDVDVHAHDTPEELEPYADPEWLPVFENLHDAPRRYLDLPGYSPFNAMYGPKLPGAIPPMPRGSSRREIVWNAEQCLAYSKVWLRKYQVTVEGGEIKIVL